MTEKSVGDELLEQVELYHRRMAELSRRMKEHPDRLPRIIQGLQDLIELRDARPRLEGEDLLKAYRGINGLIFIGPAEWEKALLGPKEENPLELEPGWCHKLVSERNLVPHPLKVIRRVIKYCRTSEWKTTPIHWLYGHEIDSPKFGQIRLDLAGQYHLWGVPHDSIDGGLVRQDVFWPNYFLGESHNAKDECLWANELPSDSWGYGVGYEHPFFTALKNWTDQQNAVRARKGLSLVSAPRDVLMLNVVYAARGMRLRLTTYSRTSTIHGGDPLAVSSYPGGADLVRGWGPVDRSGYVAASVQGVWEL